MSSFFRLISEVMSRIARMRVMYRIAIMFLCLYLIVIVKNYPSSQYYAKQLVYREKFYLVERDDDACQIKGKTGDIPAGLKIGILTLYDGPIWKEELGELSRQNKADYAALHSYTLIVANDVIDPSRPTAWTKISAMKKYLPDYDYILYIDCDALIMNQDFLLEWLVNPDKDLIISEDWGGVNTGVWLMKNSDWSLWFLDELWAQEHLVTGNWVFEYEQRAFHYLLQTDKWKKSPAGRGAVYPNSDKLWPHVGIVEQCVLNSYVIDPWSSRDRTHSYVEGDFVVHFAGFKGEAKRHLFKHYYGLSVENLLISQQKTAGGG